MTQGPRPLSLGISQGGPGPLCFQVWLRHTGAEDPAESHNWVHLPSALAARSFPVPAVRGACAVGRRRRSLRESGDPRLRPSAPPPLALRCARARGPGHARARASPRSTPGAAATAAPAAAAAEAERASERARDRGDREGGDRTRSTPGLCGGAGSGLPATGGGSGASNQAAGSRPSARRAAAARPAD